MPRGGLKIVNEANLGRMSTNSHGEKYKEVLVCLDNSLTPTTPNNSSNYILSDTTNRTTMRESSLSSSSLYGGQQRTFANLDNKSWQGGFATVVTPGTAEDQLTSEPPSVFLADFPVVNPLSLDSEPAAGRSVSRGGGRRPAIKVEEELSPEEEERRRVRRERNKQAAARCRKRRVDQTMSLQDEVDDWESKKRQLQEEIQALQSQREELKFILDAHRAVCRRPAAAQQQSASRAAVLAALPRVVVVKSELGGAVADEFTSLGVQNIAVSRHLTHEEALQTPAVPSTTSSGDMLQPFAARRPQRPASLSFLAVKSTAAANSSSNNTIQLRYSTAITSIEGVPIETPTSVVNSLNFDALMDGRTGLTPTNILTPVMSLSFSSSSLNTPTINTPSSSSGCSRQQHQHHYSLGELMGSPDNGLMKLVSL